MKRYHILYYYWGENTALDCIEILQSMGNQVDIISAKLNSYDYDETFMENIKDKIFKEKYDCIFTFNYFPIISRVSNDLNIIYISWVYDSPHLTLDSVTLSNTYNRVFLFDRILCNQYKQKGVNTVFYMPLACNHHRIKKIKDESWGKYEHEITFLGSLYQNEYDFLSQIHYLPDWLKGYIDAIIGMQLQIYGMDLSEELLNSQICSEIEKYVKIDMGDEYIYNYDTIFKNMIRKRVTVLERYEILRLIGEHYTLDLYSEKIPENLKANYLGYADYVTQMPHIFCSSKINMNLTLRSILSGLPLRVIDILGAGGFLITNYQAEMEEYFENGKDLVWFESWEDLLEKIYFYLTHDSEREKIALSGNKKVYEIFNYERQLSKIFDIAFS